MVNSADLFLYLSPQEFSDRGEAEELISPKESEGPRGVVATVKITAIFPSLLYPDFSVGIKSAKHLRPEEYDILR